MARRPSFQFYPDNWQGSANLLRCSHEEKGVWIDAMCLMHDSSGGYGILRWPLKEIGQAVHCKISTLLSLVNKGVLKGADPGGMCGPYIFTPRHGGQDGEPVILIEPQPGPIWYSSRMVRDEHIRQQRGKGTRFGDNEADRQDIESVPPPDAPPMPIPNLSPKPPFGDGALSPSLSPSLSPGIEQESPDGNSSPEPASPSSGALVEPVVFSLPCVGKGPKDWPITQKMLMEWNEVFPGLDIPAEIKRMRLWLQDNPQKRKSRLGMGRFVSGWLGRTQDRAKHTATSATPPQKAQLTEDYLAQNRAFFEGATDVPA